MNESLSETYTYLYHTIVEELLSQIVQNNHNYYVGLFPVIQRLFNIRKYINIIHYVNKLKEKGHFIISLNAEKVNDKIQVRNS